MYIFFHHFLLEIFLLNETNPLFHLAKTIWQVNFKSPWVEEELHLIPWQIYHRLFLVWWWIMVATLAWLVTEQLYLLWKCIYIVVQKILISHAKAVVKKYVHNMEYIDVLTGWWSKKRNKTDMRILVEQLITKMTTTDDKSERANIMTASLRRSGNDLK